MLGHSTGAKIVLRIPDVYMGKFRARLATRPDMRRCDHFIQLSLLRGGCHGQLEAFFTDGAEQFDGPGRDLQHPRSGMTHHLARQMK